MIFPACCPSCAQPLAPWEWLHCVVVDRAGTRAHLACLEAPTGPGREATCGYMLAPRLCNAGLLRPGARFVALAGEAAVVEVPAEELVAQERTLGGERQWFFTCGEALRAAVRAEPDVLADSAALAQAPQETQQQSQNRPNALGAGLAPPSNLRLVGNSVRVGSVSWATVTIAWDPSPDARVGGYKLEIADSVHGHRGFSFAPGQTTFCVDVPRGLWFGMTLRASGPGGPSPAISLQGTAAN